MMKQADETILVEQNITEPKPKTLPVNSSDAAEIEEVAETTSPVSESPSPNDKLFVLVSRGHLVAVARIHNILVLEFLKKNPGTLLIRPVGKEEAQNLGLDEVIERCWLISNQWFDIEEEVHHVPKPPQRRILKQPFGIDVKEPRVISQYERMFHHFDENGDGKISPAELRQCMEAKSAEEVVVKALDKDNDGLLGFDDFVKFVEELVKQEDKMGMDDFFLSDRQVIDQLMSDGKLETLYKKLHAIRSKILAVKFPSLWGNRKTTNNLLPVSRNDSANYSQFGEEALSFKDFIMSVLNMPGEQRAIMLMVFFGILKTLAESSASTPRFEFQDEIATNILSLREGLLIFSPEIANTCLFIIVYIITWPLILKLQRGQQICLAVLMTFAPFWLLSHLVRNASATGVHVRFCGFNLPVIAFTAVYTFVFCLFFFFAVYMVLSIIWKFFHQRTPARYQEPEGTNALLAGIDLE